MKINNEAEKLLAEINYYKVDYETKLAENKRASIKFCIDAYIDFAESKGFVVACNNLTCVSRSLDFEIKVYPQFDYTKEPRQPKRIKIDKNDFVKNEKTEYIIGIFNNTPLKEPDLSRLSENPYKNMTMEEIEFLEKQKDLKYYKEYISEYESNENIEYNAFDLTTQKDLGIEKNVLRLYERILE